MKHHSDDRMLKVSELAKFLGVSQSTIYRWLEAGKLPQPYELGESAVRWRLSEINQWLEEKRR
jgi:excisionase family DNA binding protein